MAAYSVDDAIEMLRAGGVDLERELSNIGAAYADITDEIETAGGEPAFGRDEFAAAIRAAVAE